MQSTPETPAEAADRKEPVEAAKLNEVEEKERQSDLLDQALLETFPASDPVSIFRV